MWAKISSALLVTFLFVGSAQAQTKTIFKVSLTNEMLLNIQKLKNDPSFINGKRITLFDGNVIETDAERRAILKNLNGSIVMCEIGLSALDWGSILNSRLAYVSRQELTIETFKPSNNTSDVAASVSDAQSGDLSQASTSWDSSRVSSNIPFTDPDAIYVGSVRIKQNFQAPALEFNSKVQPFRPMASLLSCFGRENVSIFIDTME